VYYSGLPRAVIRVLTFGVIVMLGGWRLSRQSAGAPRRRI